MRASFLTRLKKLETLSNKGRYPNFIILYRQDDGSLLNQQTGETIPADYCFAANCHVILHCSPDNFSESAGQEIIGAKAVLSLPQQYETTEQWEAAARAQQQAQATGCNPDTQQPAAQLVTVKAEPTAAEIKAAEAATTEKKINAYFENLIEKQKAQRRNRQRLSWK